MDVSAPVDIGTDFLGYRIEELIGRGGMGVVYRAYDLRLKRPVALKLVAPSLAQDARFRERFARESELVMSLEHPNVVPIHDAGDFEGRVYLAMRLVDGTDLGSLLRAEGAIEPARAMAIVAQIASALDAAHARGLVHRDVKPSNVLLDTSEHVYLADFGLTRRLDDESSELGFNRSIGTPAYLAPEQLEGGPVDGRADVYSLGCVLFECLTGEPIFPRGSRLAVAWAHLEEEPPKPSVRRNDLPEAIDAVLDKALAKDPEQRYATCEALIADAGEALGLGTTRSSRRRRTLLVGAATGLAIVAAVAVTMTTLPRGNRTSTPPLRAGQNSIVRINPATDKVSAVVHVPVDPVVAASSDRRVWLYSDSGTISEFDPRTNRVVKKAAASLVRPAECCSVYSGPVLAADASGAWFVTGRLPGKGMLVRVPVQGRERKYPVPVTPTGVGVGDGFVWIVGHTPRGGEVLRVNPADGRVTARRRFAASALVNSIAFGFHHVWVASSARSMLYRLDPQLRLRPISVHVADSHITRPELIAGDVWIRVNDAKGTTRWFDPSSLKKIHTESDGPPSYEEYAWNGSLWWYDQPSGSVYRQNGEGASIEQIQVTRSLPAAGGPCLRSIATVGGEVWVTVGSSVTPDAYVCGA